MKNVGEFLQNSSYVLSMVRLSNNSTQRVIYLDRRGLDFIMDRFKEGDVAAFIYVSGEEATFLIGDKL
jgi:hypothetical protein